MKKVICLSGIGVMLGLGAAVNLPKEYKDYTQARRYCVGRDTKTLPGYVITTWYRNGKPDTILPAVTTNALKTITGKEQNNPLQVQIKKLSEDLKELDQQLQAEIIKYMTASNRAAVAEARVASAKAGLTEERATWQAKYDKASTLLKPVYKLGLDLIDKILAKLDALMEAGK